MTVYGWVDATVSGKFPSGAIQGGVDIDGHKVYVGRANYNGDLLPAKLVPGKRGAYVCYAGKEIEVCRFEVLCQQNIDWEPSCGGNVPKGAIDGGRTSDGETLYIGRARHNGSTMVGKVHPSHGCLFLPFGGKEHAKRSYEVLVLKQ